MIQKQAENKMETQKVGNDEDGKSPSKKVSLYVTHRLYIFSFFISTVV